MTSYQRSNVASRSIRMALIGAAIISVLAGCSATGGSTGPTADGQPGVSAADVTTLQGLVADAEKVPAFVAPGPAFDTSKVAGKKLMIIPSASQLPGCDTISKDLQTLAQKVGMTATYFENSGGAAGWIPGMQQAVSQHYDAIALVCSIDPNLIKPQIQAATAAGIAVVDAALDDSVNGAKTDPLVTAQTNVASAESIRRALDVALIDNASAPFDVFLVTSNDVPPAVPMADAARDEIAKYCPECGMKETNIAVPDWGTKVQSEVATALVADPKIKVVVTLFDGEAPQAAAAIKQVGRTDVKLYGNFGATPEYVKQMGSDALYMATDTGPSNLWRAYTMMDQTLRVLAGVGPAPADKAGDPNRLFTANNYTEISNENDGFGTDFVKGYESLWGLN